MTATLHLLLIVAAVGPAGASMEPSAMMVAATLSPTRSTPRRLLTRPEALLASYRSGGLRHCPADLGSASVDELTALPPLGSRDIDCGADRTLRLAFAIAMRKIHSVPACEALFTDRGHDGRVLLATTVYLGADPGAERRFCRRGAAAFTLIGKPVTYLCSSFARFSPHEGAMYLLHEALHYAGEPEWPHDPHGMKPAAINQLVRNRCGL